MKEEEINYYDKKQLLSECDSTTLILPTTKKSKKKTKI